MMVPTTLMLDVGLSPSDTAALQSEQPAEDHGRRRSCQPAIERGLHHENASLLCSFDQLGKVTGVRCEGYFLWHRLHRLFWGLREKLARNSLKNP